MKQKPLGACRVVLPAANAGGAEWAQVYAFLVQRFPRIAPAVWQQRFATGKVLDAQGQPLHLTAPYVPGATVYYFRELAAEPEVPFTEQILFENERLVVVDKPHFLATAPVGQYVEQTVLRRLQRRLQLPDLSPAHRLDRLTAGVLLLCKRKQDRAAYQELFRWQQMHKVYEAIAPALPELSFPYVKQSHLENDPQHFFLTREGQGAANSETQIEVLQRGAKYWHYQLTPITGRKHQLRVHLASLGAPILGDDFYPAPQARTPDNYQQPLQLLARRLAFTDPLSGEAHCFESRRQLFSVSRLA